MASNDIITVTVEVDTTTGEQKLVQLGRTAEHVGAQTQQATGKMQEGVKGVSTAVSNLNTYLAVFGATVGAAAFVTFLKSAYIDAARTERAFNGLAAQVRALGGSSGAVRQFINGLSEQANVLDDDLIPAYQRLFLVTQDTSAAQYLLELATKAANNGIGTIQGNAERLALALQTNTARSLREFGILTKDTENKALNAADGIQAVADKLRALPDRLNDAQDRLSTLARSWDQLKDSTAAATEAFLSWVAAQQSAATKRNTRQRLYNGQPAITEDVTRLAKQEEDHYAAMTRAEGALAVARIAGKEATEARTKAEKDLDVSLGRPIDVGLINRVGAAQVAAAQARARTIPQIASLSPTALGAAPAVNIPPEILRMSDTFDSVTAATRAWIEARGELTKTNPSYVAALDEAGKAATAAAAQTELASNKFALAADVISGAGQTMAQALFALASGQEVSARAVIHAIAQQTFAYATSATIENLVTAYKETALEAASAAELDPVGTALHANAAAVAFQMAALTAALGGGALAVGAATGGAGGAGGTRGSAARHRHEQSGPTTRTHYGAVVYEIHANDAKSFEQSLNDSRRARAVTRSIDRRRRRAM